MLGNDLIASYEVDFKLLKTIIDRKLDDARDLYGEPRKAVMREIERAIDDADEIVGLFIYSSVYSLFPVTTLPSTDYRMIT